MGQDKKLFQVSISTLIRFLILISICLGGITFLIRLCYGCCFHERLQIESHLEQFSSQCSYSISGEYELWYQVRTIEVTLKEDAKSKFSFYTSPSTIKSGYNINLVKIGNLAPFSFKIDSNGKRTGSQPGINVGKNGEFSNRFSFAIQSIEDIITNYGLLLDEVRRWPTFENAKFFESKEGCRIGYYSREIENR